MCFFIWCIFRLSSFRVIFPVAARVISLIRGTSDGLSSEVKRFLGENFPEISPVTVAEVFSIRLSLEAERFSKDIFLALLGLSSEEEVSDRPAVKIFLGMMESSELFSV